MPTYVYSRASIVLVTGLAVIFRQLTIIVGQHWHLCTTVYLPTFL